ncbi:hypothetical protein [Moraxella lacunata]
MYSSYNGELATIMASTAAKARTMPPAASSSKKDFMRLIGMIIFSYK